MTKCAGQSEQFIGSCRPQSETQNETNCAKVFKMFFTDELMDIIVRETNTFAEQKIRARSLIPFRSRIRDWKLVTADEMNVVIALFMLMRMIQKLTPRYYFSKNSILATPVFSSVISMDCFEATCNFMHFNNERIGTYHEPSKLFKIYPVLSYLNKKLQSLYLSWQNIAIDESLTQWRGRLSFRWYIPLRASKFEIKSYELCDSSSGYLWPIIIYRAKTLCSGQHSFQTTQTKQRQLCCHLWSHSTDKNVPRLLERHFSRKNTTYRQKGHANKKVCSVLQTQ
jgi:hypothetical protein